MPIYYTNGLQETGGQTIGILCLDESLPFVPGDANNAGSYDFPVKFRRIAGLDSVQLSRGDRDCLADLLAAGRELESEGVRAILGNAGQFLQYQQQLSDGLQVPVATSRQESCPCPVPWSGL